MITNPQALALVRTVRFYRRASILLIAANLLLFGLNLWGYLHWHHAFNAVAAIFNLIVCPYLLFGRRWFYRQIYKNQK